MASDAKAGAIYAIQQGDSLLATASHAYGAKAGTTERLRLAQKINAHPLNRRFWRAPATAFERTNFPDGIVSFSADFTSGDPQRRAEKGEARSFARLFIPPREDRVHPRFGPAVPLPPGAAPQQPNPNPCDYLDAGCLTPLHPSHVSIGSSDDRLPVANPLAEIPHRWICSIVIFFQDPQGLSWSIAGGTGVRIGTNHVLTAAHVLQYLTRVGSTSSVTSTVSLALVFGRNGLVAPTTPAPMPAAAMSSYGGILVTDTSGFWVPPEWSAALAKGETPDSGKSDLFASDYGLIRFDPANRCKAVATLGAAPRYWGVGTSTASVSDTAAFWSDLHVGHALRTAGYPGDRPCTQWESHGPLRELFSVGKEYFQTKPKNAWMSFDADFAGGMSGSPVWRHVPGRKGDPERLVLAGIGGSSAARGLTYAAALTPFVWDRLRKEMAPK